MCICIMMMMDKKRNLTSTIRTIFLYIYLSVLFLADALIIHYSSVSICFAYDRLDRRHTSLSFFSLTVVYIRSVAINEREHWPNFSFSSLVFSLMLFEGGYWWHYYLFSLLLSIFPNIDRISLVFFFSIYSYLSVSHEKYKNILLLIFRQGRRRKKAFFLFVYC